MKFFCTGVAIRFPKIGERLNRKPEFGMDNPGLLPCTVVYANRAHLYYTVRFDAGYRESYKFGG